MSFLQNSAESGFLPALCWTVGVPLVLVSVVLGGAVFGTHYARLVERVPDTDRFLRQPWFAGHRRRNVRVLWGVYGASIFPGRMGVIAHAIFAFAMLGFALFMAGWAVRFLLRHRDRSSRAYGVGLLAGALFLSFLAAALYCLNAAASGGGKVV